MVFSVQLDWEKQSSLCLIATSGGRGVGSWAALYIYHDTHLRSSELWFISKVCWTHWLYATP